MSKVKFITNNLINYLNRYHNVNFRKIDKSWLIDEKSNLYKIKIFEDGYSISSESEFPEEIKSLPKDNKYKKITLYLEKVSRNKFVSDKLSLHKFSFNTNETIYYYLCNNLIDEEQIFNQVQIVSKNRKRRYSEDYTSVKNVKIDWSQMVSASKVRNYLLDDPLLDWLEEYNINDINNTVKNCKPNSLSRVRNYRDNDNIDEFTKHIMENGLLFEREVINLLSKDYNIVQASESFQAREVRNYDYTVELMKEGIPIIYQAVLHNYEDKTYGCPDLLIRSDYINKIFNQNLIEDSETKSKSLLLGTDFYYVVVDIKHSTLHFNVDFKTLRNRDSIPAYKGQLYIYNEALSKIQGYNPNKAFILGKMWNWKNMTGTNFLEKMGVVDYDNFDSNYKQQTEDAVKWIRRVINEGSEWKLVPTPSIPQLYPNMNNEKDGKWRFIKNDLSKHLSEITSLWMCGIKNRIVAHNNDIFSYKDNRCTAKNLGFKEGFVSETLDKIIKVNKDNFEGIVHPNKVKTELVNGVNWRSIPEDTIEFYLDYETMNSNLGHVLIEDNKIGYQDNQFIFQIGLGYIKNNKWTYKSFIAPTNSLMGEVTMINNFWNYVNKVKKEERKEVERFIHWYNAEPISYLKLQERVRKVGIELPNKNFFDLYKLFRQEPITINGSLNFSLKSVAKALNKHKLIKTSWDSTNPCSNGLNAMLLAHKAYNDNNGNISEKNVIISNIIHYNQVDCKVLWEIISYLRIYK